MDDAGSARGRYWRHARRDPHLVSSSRQRDAFALAYGARAFACAQGPGTDQRFMTQRIGVLGSGSWGTALAVHLAHTGHDVRLWARDAALVADMSAARENRPYLPGIELPSALAPTSDLRLALDGAQFVVIAAPSHGVRDVARLANRHLPSGCVIVSATKGLEAGSLLGMSEVLRQEFPD